MYIYLLHNIPDTVYVSLGPWLDEMGLALTRPKASIKLYVVVKPALKGPSHHNFGVFRVAWSL